MPTRFRLTVKRNIYLGDFVTDDFIRDRFVLPSNVARSIFRKLYAYEEIGNIADLNETLFA